MKTIFQKLLVTYLAIIIVITAVLAIFLTQSFHNFLFEREQEKLLATGKQVGQLVLACKTGESSEEELERAVTALGSASGARIFVFRDDRLAGITSSAKQQANLREADGLLADVGEILQGKTIVRKKHYSQKLGEYVVFAGMPVKEGEKTEGLILLFAPVAEVNKALAEIYGIIWGISLFSLLLAGGIIWAVSRRISRPVAELRKAAANLAAGDFTTDLQVEGKDELAELSRSFNYMKNKLKEGEQLRKELIANISHELRTPITTVRGFIQALLEKVVPAEQQDDYLRLAYRETRRLTDLVQDLLDLTRLQAGGIKLKISEVRVKELLEETAAELGLAAAEKGLTIKTSAPEDLTVKGDRDRLKQVILNLCGNAVKYSPEGSEISLRAVSNGKLIELWVEDNGPGIPREDLERIFEKFYRVEEGRRSGCGGSGLGLAVAREIIELHKGRIKASNRPQGGTEITVSLPA